jgi:hypothetical protein
MVTGAPFSGNPADAAVSYRTGYDYFGKAHKFRVYACDAYGNITITPELAANTVTVSISDAYAQPVTPFAISNVLGYSDIYLIFHTAKSGMSVSAHTTQAGAVDYITPTFTTYAGPAYGMQMILPGISVIDGSAHTTGALSNWYNGTTGIPATQLSGAAFPVTMRAADIFGNYSIWPANLISAYAGNSPFITPYPGSFPTNTDRFNGYLSDVEPGTLTFTAKYNVTQSISILIQVEDLSCPGPSCLNRTLDSIPAVSILLASPTMTYTPSYTNSATPTITITGSITDTVTVDTYTLTPVFTQTGTVTSTATATVSATATATATAAGFLVTVPVQGSSYAYPQPANDSVNIVYFLQEQKDIVIRVYDLYGSMKASVKQSGNAMAVNTITLDISKLASGLYVYSISANAKGESKLNFKAGKFAVLKK